MRNTEKEFCIRGHPFTKSNTLIRRDGSRECRPCRRLRQSGHIRGDPIKIARMKPNGRISIDIAMDDGKLFHRSLPLNCRPNRHRNLEDIVNAGLLRGVKELSELM